MLLAEVLEEAGESFGKELAKKAAEAAVTAGAKKAAKKTAGIVVDGLKGKYDEWRDEDSETGGEDEENT